VTGPRAEDQYHTGIVTDDFEGTCKRLTELFGYEWCDEIVADAAVRVMTPEGPVETTITSRFTYSTNEPRLEVIRPIPGTVWVPADSGVHHLGYWSDDVPAASAALAAQGMPLEVGGIGPDGALYWAYHRGPDGPRIELVSSVIRPFLEQLWSPKANGDPAA
jgi:hypothetical protein